jgi:phospholipid/cholesterol/gamma-HCH transport system substrate-binding protein
METRANYTLVGLFTLAVIAAGFGFIYWFTRGGESGERAVYRVIFDGSVSGLRTGGSVLFNGIKIGEVTDLKLNPRDPKKAVATIAVDKAIALRADTQANLEFQGLTGIASVALQGGQSDAPVLSAPPGDVPTIVAQPSAMQDVWQGARELLGRADGIMRRVDTFLADNDAPLRNTLRNIDKFTTALGDNAEEVGAFMKDAATAARRIAALSDNIDKLAGDLGVLVKAVDPDKVASVVDNIDKMSKAIDPSKVASVIDNVDTFSKGLAGQTDKMVAFIDDARAVAARLNEMAGRLDPTLNRIGELAQAIDPQRVQRTVENVDKFTEALGKNSVYVDGLMKDAAEIARKFNDMSGRIDTAVARFNDLAQAVDPQKVSRTIENVDKFADSLGQNSARVDGLLKDAADIAHKFNEMTPRIDKILANVEGLTGSEEGKGVIAEVTEAARSFRKMADNLDKRIAELSAGLTRFTGSGLREWEALASEGRRTLGEINRAVKNFDSNPQRVIFGGSGSGGVPQYNGRR